MNPARSERRRKPPTPAPAPMPALAAVDRCENCVFLGDDDDEDAALPDCEEVVVFGLETEDDDNEDAVLPDCEDVGV
jgi:hypothetical protein